MGTTSPFCQTALRLMTRWRLPCGVALLAIGVVGLSVIEGLCNFDPHHPGLMLGPALDLKHGLKPFKETVILYGYLSTYLQSLALYVFGENLLAIWSATSIVYAAALVLSYNVFCQLLPRSLAFVTTFIVFLLHPYITFPWSNYYSYGFSLVALLCLSQALQQPKTVAGRFDRPQAIHATIVGMAFYAAILARSSAALAIVLTIGVFCLIEYIASKADFRQWLLQQILWMLVGSGTAFLIFAGYCVSVGVWDDFLTQSAIVDRHWRSTWLGILGYREGSETVFLLSVLCKKILLPLQQITQDLRLSIFSVNFFVMIAFAISYSWQRLRRRPLMHHDRIAFLLSLFSIFSYMNAVHSYEVFRLVNGAAIGLGSVSYLLLIKFKLAQNRIYQCALGIVLVALTVVLLNNLLPLNKPQWNSFWDINRVLKWQGNQIPAQALTHQLFLPSQEVYYQEIAAVLAQFDSSYMVINETNNSLLSILTDKPNAYLMPAFISEGLKTDLGDRQRAEMAIRSGKAIVISYGLKSIPLGCRPIHQLRTISMPPDHPLAITVISVALSPPSATRHPTPVQH
jgi:hypothetical protein